MHSINLNTITSIQFKNLHRVYRDHRNETKGGHASTSATSGHFTPTLVNLNTVCQMMNEVRIKCPLV